MASSSLPQAFTAPFVDRQVGVRNQAIRVHLHAGAETRAVGAHAHRGVEREELRRRLGEGEIAVAAGALLRHHPIRLAFHGHDHHTLAELQRLLDRVGQPRPIEIGLGDQPVHHRFDRVLPLLVETDVVLESDHRAVHARPGEAGAPDGLEDILMLALASIDERGQDEELPAFLERGELGHDLLRRLRLHVASALGAGKMTDAREEDAEIVVNLRHRPDGGARIRGSGLLLDRDGGGEAADGVVERLVHLTEELPGVGVQALDVAALTLGVERVEGQGRLARARRPREHHELLLGDRERDVLEIVLARAGDDDRIWFQKALGREGAGRRNYSEYRACGQKERSRP